MIISLLAIAIVMVVSWLFGIFCDRMFDRWLTSVCTEDDDPEIDLVACKYCKYKEMTLYDEPCVSCTGGLNDKWEMDNR